METGTILNSVGLSLDIIGVIILFIYGLPKNLNEEGNSFLILEETDRDEKQKWKTYNRISKFGLPIIIIGFTLQLISNFN